MVPPFFVCNFLALSSLVLWGKTGEFLCFRAFSVNIRPYDKRIFNEAGDKAPAQRYA
jgi:hypothetical protein